MSSTPVASPKAFSAALAKGTVIAGKYRIDDVIAEGGMGVVYKGWHLLLEHPIAVKVVRPEYMHHAEAAARFVNEAKTCAQLHGIHATHVLDLGRIENGPPMMVLEYLEGFDLRRLLSRQGPLSLGSTIDYVLQACEALAEVHSQGLVHRDLKPENLVITQLPDGTELLKLIDFGIAKRLGSPERSLTQQGYGFGSPDYMAPEQMSNPEQVDARADIWSMGVILFELLTNSVPFRGETVQAKCANVICDEPIALRSIRPELPVQLERVVFRCIRKAPEERYRDVGELARELVLFAEEAYSQTLGRVRALFGDNTPREESPVLAALGQVAMDPGRATDMTPVPPEDLPRKADLRVPMQPLWPISLSVAALTLVALLIVAFRRPAELQRGTDYLWETALPNAQIAAQDLAAAVARTMWTVTERAAQAVDSVRNGQPLTSRTSRARLLVPMIDVQNRFAVPTSVEPPGLSASPAELGKVAGD